jgi:hypothetical protein
LKEVKVLIERLFYVPKIKNNEDDFVDVKLMRDVYGLFGNIG